MVLGIRGGRVVRMWWGYMRMQLFVEAVGGRVV